MARTITAEMIHGHAPRNIASTLSVSHSIRESVLESLRGSGRTYRTVDLLLLTSTLLLTLSLQYSRSTHLALAASLQRGVSFRSILIGWICILAWRIILNAVGVYDPIRIRSLSEYLTRCITGFGGCSLIVGSVLCISSARDTSHFGQPFLRGHLHTHDVGGEGTASLLRSLHSSAFSG